MGARIRTWLIFHPVITALIALFVPLIVLVILLGEYKFGWDWTGLGPYISPSHPKDSDFQRGKTLWDWLQLLFIPIAVAIVAFWFSQMQKSNEQKIAEDNQQESALQGYINEISELLLEKNLRKPKPEDEVSIIGRVRTLTILPRLDKRRKGSVLKFIYESDLIQKDKCIIKLKDADLRVADLFRVDLHEADLRETKLLGAKLEEANLCGSDLSKANLLGVNLEKANLTGANLLDASLRYANMTGAIVTDEQLAKAKSLQGATMHDGSIHP
jgi:uncharacterized protein YjbI with pentapeptide repeats